jgi:hypothetical protein
MGDFSLQKYLSCTLIPNCSVQSHAQYGIFLYIKRCYYHFFMSDFFSVLLHSRYEVLF